MSPSYQISVAWIRIICPTLTLIPASSWTQTGYEYEDFAFSSWTEPACYPFPAHHYLIPSLPPNFHFVLRLPSLPYYSERSRDLAFEATPKKLPRDKLNYKQFKMNSSKSSNEETGHFFCPPGCQDPTYGRTLGPSPCLWDLSLKHFVLLFRRLIFSLTHVFLP